MSQKKPSNWYDMTSNEQRAWQREKQAMDDLEYEKDRAQEAAERTARDLREKERHMRSEVSWRDEEIERYSTEIDELQELIEEQEDKIAHLEDELALMRQWVRENGHDPAFDTWVDGRRLEDREPDVVIDDTQTPETPE